MSNGYNKQGILLFHRPKLLFDLPFNTQTKEKEGIVLKFKDEKSIIYW